MGNDVERGESALLATIEELRDMKPEERSELSRYFAVVLTDLEHVLAYYKTFISPLLEE